MRIGHKSLTTAENAANSIVSVLFRVRFANGTVRICDLFSEKRICPVPTSLFRAGRFNRLRTCLGCDWRGHLGFFRADVRCV